MLQGMDQSEFGQFVAALWEQQGWKTQVKRDGGRVFIAAQRPQTGEEGLLWAIPGTEEVGGKQVQQFVKLCKQYGVEESAIVTAGTVSDHAEKVASGTGVELLDGTGVEQIVKHNDLTDLVEQHGGGSGAGGGDEGAADGDSPLDQIQAIGEQGLSTVSNLVGDTDVPVPVSGRLVGVVVVVVALLGAGVLFGPSLPFIGGGGGGSGPISAASVAPNQSATTLHVSWNAKVVDSIDPNESDGRAYYPPPGEQFVLVRMSINNTGEQKVPLKQTAFRLETENGTYGFQKLADHDGFLDFPISPGQHYIGWTVFSVPKGATGTLVYDQNVTGTSVTVEFEYDSGLPVTVAQR